MKRRIAGLLLSFVFASSSIVAADGLSDYDFMDIEMDAADTFDESELEEQEFYENEYLDVIEDDTLYEADECDDTLEGDIESDFIDETNDFEDDVEDSIEEKNYEMANLAGDGVNPYVVEIDENSFPDPIFREHVKKCLIWTMMDFFLLWK